MAEPAEYLELSGVGDLADTLEIRSALLIEWQGRVVDAARRVVEMEDVLTDTGNRDGLHEAWVELREALGVPTHV